MGITRAATWCLTLASILVTAGVYAAAQTRSQVRTLSGPEIDRLLRERIQPGTQTRASRESRRLRELLGRDVSYEEVLKAPDDVQLNIAFARTQIRKGDVNGAAATLERILLIAPDSLSVRVLYAIVLFRLDNRKEAERELRIVLARRLPPDLKATLTGYLEELRQREKRTRFSMLLHTSGQYETNRSSGPSANAVEGVTGLIPLRGDEARNSDWAWQGLVRFGVEHDLGFQRRHRVFANVSIYDSEQFRLDRLTLRAADATAGIILDYTPVEVFLFGHTSFIQLSHEPYLRTGRLVVRPVWRVDPLNTLIGTVRFEYRDFDELSETVDERLRTGPDLLAGLAWQRRFSVNHRVTVGGNIYRNWAETKHYRHFGTTLFVRYDWLPGRGIVVSGSFEWNQFVFDAPNLNESAKTRHQNTLITGVLVSVPVAVLMPRTRVRKRTSDTTVSLGVEYERGLSNVTNYTYANWRFTLGITTFFSF